MNIEMLFSNKTYPKKVKKTYPMGQRELIEYRLFPFCIHCRLTIEYALLCEVVKYGESRWMKEEEQERDYLNAVMEVA